MGQFSGFVFIMGRQRSGTTVFRKMLESDPGFTDIGEIFLDGNLDYEKNFFAFQIKKVLQNNNDIHFLREQSIFIDFMKSVAESLAGTRPIVDVKYGGMHAIRSEAPSLDDPYLAQFVRNQGIPIFHLIRRNKLRVLVSEALAIKTGVWGIERHDTAVPGAGLFLDPYKLHSRLEGEVRQSQHFGSLFVQHPRYTRIFYEEMIGADGRFDARVMDVVHAFLGAERSFDPVPALAKQGVAPLSDVIANWDEVQRALTGTEFEWMLRD